MPIRTSSLNRQIHKLGNRLHLAVLSRTHSQGADQPPSETEQALREERRLLKEAQAIRRVQAGLPKEKPVKVLKAAKPPKPPKAPKAAKPPKAEKVAKDKTASKDKKPSRADKLTKKAENAEAAKKADRKSAKT
jgi:putative endonuclease